MALVSGMGFLLAQSISTTQGRNIPIVVPSFVSTLNTPAKAQQIQCMLQCSFILSKIFCDRSEKQNHRHSFLKIGSDINYSFVYYLFEKVYLPIRMGFPEDTPPGSYALISGSTYLWLSGSSLKKNWVPTIMPFSVPESTTR